MFPKISKFYVFRCVSNDFIGRITLPIGLSIRRIYVYKELRVRKRSFLGFNFRIVRDGFVASRVSCAIKEDGFFYVVVRRV